MLLQEKQKKTKQNGKYAKTPIKLVFWGGYPNMRKCKKWILSKTCLAPFVSGREKKRASSCTLCFGHKLFWVQNSQNEENYIKIAVPTEIAENQKGHHFYWKTCRLAWVKKVGFTNCVFEKLCSSENILFIVFSAKHSSCSKKAVLKNKKFMKSSGLFLNMARRCFRLLFSGFNVFVVCFLCVWSSSKSVKDACVFFPVLGRLWGRFFLFIWIWKV